jgi:CheY-like chemotaxis protein
VDVSNEMPVQHNFTAEEKKDLEEWQKKLVDARRLIYAVGKENVNSALNKVLADIRTFPGHARLPSVGALLARELALLDPNGDLLTPPGDIHQIATQQSPVSTSVALVPVQITTEEPRVRVRIGANSLETIAEKPEDAKNKEKKKKNGNGEALAPVVDTVAPVSSSSGLVNGLDSPEQIVQYACALALAQTDKFPMKWIGSEKVAGLLGRGISEAKSIQILVVEEDTNYANDLRGKLEGLGYGVSLAISGRDGVTQARSFPPKDIAVISNVLRRDLSSEQLLEELRADVRTRYLVYGVLSAQADRTAMQARFGSEAALVEREVSGGDLKNQIEAIAAKRPAESLTKRKALETSIECATALTKVDPRDSYLLLNDAVEHAIAALANRKDEVRIPSAIFIGHVAGGSFADKAAVALKAVIEDANNAAELRRVALIAYGSVVKQGLEEVAAKVQTDADQGVKDAGARAFGQTQRSRADIIKFINANRIEGEKKTK